MNGAWRLGLIGLVVVVQGCALAPSRTPPPNEAAWQQRYQSYQGLSSWVVQARMATAVLGWSGGLQWRQAGEQVQLKVTGPMGIGGFHAQGDLDYVQVRTSDNRQLAGDPELLYQQEVGWPFPLRNMRYWSRGLPTPEMIVEQRIDAHGRITELQQSGWLVRYQEYRQYGEFELPRRLLLENGEISIRIVIDDWSGLVVE